MSLLDFALTPVELVEPWESQGTLSLHWFGLSDGTYHVNLGTVRLLEYVARDGWPHFVEYQLARLHEDVLAMLPDVLEPIPAAATRHFVSGRLGSSLRALRDLWQDSEDSDLTLDAALEALGNRQLDTGYLSPSAGIWIWNDGVKIVIEWDNRDQFVDGQPAWTATYGRHELRPEEFVEEVHDFHIRLMAAMNERVQQVRSNWARHEVKLDLKRLAAEQIERTGAFDSAVRRATVTIDWQAVETALSRTATTGSA